jgi:hypothetical protein
MFCMLLRTVIRALIVVGASAHVRAAEPESTIKPIPKPDLEFEEKGTIVAPEIIPLPMIARLSNHLIDDANS